MNKAMEEKVLKYIDDNCEEAFLKLSELVKIDTQNFYSHGNENEGQVYLEKICKEIGLSVDIFTPESVEGLVDTEDYKAGRQADKRNNLVAILKGEEDKNGVMLTAHMDTMPAGDLSKWDDDPFSGIIRDGKIYGRGVGDDKFGLIIPWFLMKAFKECGFTPKKNLLLGSYCDEEGGGGNGALGLAMKYPSEFVVNLDGKGYEAEALGGGCFKIDLKTTLNDAAIASMVEVFEGAKAIVEELKVWGKQPGKILRLSNVSCGIGGEKKGSVSFAIYTDKTKEETKQELVEIFEKVKPVLDEQNLASEGFILTTRFFRYGKTEDSKEAKILADCIKELTGEYPDPKGTCLSDLPMFLYYSTKNSLNYGIPRGDEKGGGAHQPNEYIECKNMVECMKAVALTLLRI